MLFARQRLEPRTTDLWADVGRFLEWHVCLQLRCVSSTFEIAMRNACQHVELSKPQQTVAKLRRSLRDDATGLFSFAVERATWDEVAEDVEQLSDWFASSGPALKRLSLASKLKRSRQNECAMSLTALLAKALNGVSNRHLVEISVIHGGASSSFNYLVGAPAQSVRFVQSLVLDGSDFSVADMELLSSVAVANRLKGLTTLSLKYCKLSAEQIEPLVLAIRDGALRDIKSLDLSVNALGDAGMQALVDAVVDRRPQPLANLEKLELRTVGLTAAGLASFSRLIACGALPKLTSLALDGNHTGADGWQHLAAAFQKPGAPNLRSLSLRRMRASHEGFAALAAAWQTAPSLAGLTALNVSGNMAGDAGFGSLVQALSSPNSFGLRKLSVGGNDATHVGVVRLIRQLAAAAPHRKFTHLNVSGNVVGVVGSRCLLELARTGAFDGLEYLNLSWMAIDEGTKHRLWQEHVRGRLQAVQQLIL